MNLIKSNRCGKCKVWCDNAVDDGRCLDTVCTNYYVTKKPKHVDTFVEEVKDEPVVAEVQPAVKKSFFSRVWDLVSGKK